MGVNSHINKLLDEFTELENNWNEDDLLSPSKEAIKRARYITLLLENHGQTIYHATPGPNGEIMLEIRNSANSKSVSLYFINTRNLLCNFRPMKSHSNMILM